jgi:hypothetical protein
VRGKHLSMLEGQRVEVLRSTSINSEVRHVAERVKHVAEGGLEPHLGDHKGGVALVLIAAKSDGGNYLAASEAHAERPVVELGTELQGCEGDKQAAWGLKHNEKM